MKSATDLSAFSLVSAFALLVTSGCLFSRMEPVSVAPQPRDLTPVTWLDAPSHAPVEIVQAGKPCAVIYVAEPGGRAPFDPRDYRYVNSPFPPALPRLVHELVEIVRLGTGAALEFVDNPPSAAQPAIVIGDCEETRRAGIDAASLPIEGFLVKTARNRVYLVGSTRPLPAGWAGKNDGTAWAVADFLERFVGVRWYWPAEYGGRSILRTTSLVIPPVCYRDQPVFLERAFHPEQNLMFPLSYAPHYSTPRDLMTLPVPLAPGVGPDGEVYVTQVPHLPLARYGSSLPYQPLMQGTRAAEVAGAAAQRKPRVEAMFALKKDGKRDYNVFCYSAPETLDYLLDCCALAWDQGGSGGLWIVPSGINLWFPSTPGLACNCAACLATAAPYREDRERFANLAAKQGERRAFETIEQLVHERVFGLFVQRVSEAVKQRWPEKKVIYHPWDTNCPEGVEFADNLAVHNLNLGFMMGLLHQPAVRRQQEERLRVWSRRVKAPAGLAAAGTGACCRVGARFGFYGPSDWTLGPVQYPHVVQAFYQANQDFVIGSQVPTYSLPCWTTAAPTWYVWMRVLWNPALDVDATLDEMCRRLFGAGATSARELLRLECERWEGSNWARPLLQDAMQSAGEGSLRFPDDEYFRQSWPPDVVARMKALRGQALEEMAGDPQARQAFLYWTWAFDEFVRFADTLYGGGSSAPALAPAVSVASTTSVATAMAGGSFVQPVASWVPVTKTNAVDGAVLVLIPAGEFRMGTSEAERGGWLAAHPDTDRSDLIRFTAIEESSSFGGYWRGTNEAQRTAWLQEPVVRHDNPMLFRDEMPQHVVYLDAYYMYKTEVTVAQYRKFCQATGRVLPPEPRKPGFGGKEPAKGQETHPIVNVSWADAQAYANWAGAALPTEAEWEKAARGGDQRIFPWGDAWPPPVSENIADATFGAIRLRSKYFLDGYKDGFAFTAPAGSFAANPYGLCDMGGNVAEWCADWYDADYYKNAPQRNPTGPTAGVWRVLRGGSWYDAMPWTFRTANRGDYDHLPVSSASFVAGFRCVVRVSPRNQR